MLKCVLSLSLFLGVVFGDQCPPETLTRPCVCETTGGVSLVCEDIQGKDVLDGVFRRTGNHEFGTFQLVNSRVDSIPARDLLVPKKLKYLTVMETNMTRLFDEEPDEANSLLMLSLESIVFRQGIPWRQFRNLKGLRYMSFYKIDIPVLGSEFKRNVNSDLKLLMVQNSKVATRVEDGVLSGFESLTDLRIEYSHLSKIKRNWFPTPSAIQFLSFEGNQISSVPEDMFSNMPSLKILSLQKNKLTTLSEQAFKDIAAQLTTLDVRDNPIVCDCSIKWVTSQENTLLLGYCASPQNLKGKMLQELTSSDLGACQ